MNLTKLSDLSVLMRYKERQVILNYYEEDSLVDRDGFHFQHILLKDEKIAFIKSNVARFEIPIRDFPSFYRKGDFQNYFFLTNGSSRMEIYFP